MGLISALTHTLVKTVLSSLIIWVVLVAFMQIPMEKMPMLLLVVLIANIVASIVASGLLAWQRTS
jgi:hypothetical protein